MRRVSMEAPPSPHQRQSAWLGKLSHDLRNQLAPMRTATQLLLSGRLDADRQSEMLHMVDRQVVRMARMLDDLAEYGRLQAGTNTVRRERLDGTILVDTALGECGGRLRAAGLTLESTLPDQRVPIDGERQRLVQAIVRLLDNAARFTPAGGRVELRLELVEQDALISVADSGSGIEASRLQSIFELPDGPRASEHLGLSLLLARRCAEDHGGTLEAHSDGPGHGSTFVMRLPLPEAA
jgi:two-component system, sensor histidine kinase